MYHEYMVSPVFLSLIFYDGMFYIIADISLTLIRIRIPMLYTSGILLMILVLD